MRAVWVHEVTLSNDTIKKPDERWLFREDDSDLRIYNKTIRLQREANYLNRIFTNGPPVELVSVAERLEAVITKALLLRAGSRHTAGRSEARRGFCQSWYKLSE